MGVLRIVLIALLVLAGCSSSDDGSGSADGGASSGGGDSSGGDVGYESPIDAINDGETNFVDVIIDEGQCSHLTSGFELESGRELIVFARNALDVTTVSLTNVDTGEVLGPFTIAANDSSTFKTNVAPGSYQFDCGFEPGFRIAGFVVK